MPYTLALHELVQLCERLLGWDETDTLRLLVGSSPASVAGARSLAALRDRVAARPDLVDALRDGAADPVAALHAVDPDVADELRRLAARARVAPDELRPRLARDHRTTRRGNPAAPPRRRRAPDGDVAAQAEAAALAQLAEADHGGFVAALEQARRVYPVREENSVLTDELPCGILRRWVLEAGLRLVGRGRLARVDDAVFCTADELADALRGGTEELEPSSRVDGASRRGPEPIPVRPSSASSTSCRTFASSPRTDGA